LSNLAKLDVDHHMIASSTLNSLQTTNRYFIKRTYNTCI